MSLGNIGGIVPGLHVGWKKRGNQDGNRLPKRLLDGCGRWWCGKRKKQKEKEKERGVGVLLHMHLIRIVSRKRSGRRQRDCWIVCHKTKEKCAMLAKTFLLLVRMIFAFILLFGCLVLLLFGLSFTSLCLAILEQKKMVGLQN
jgi:hypothetical protein